MSTTFKSPAHRVTGSSPLSVPEPSLLEDVELALVAGFTAIALSEGAAFEFSSSSSSSNGRLFCLASLFVNLKNADVSKFLIGPGTAVGVAGGTGVPEAKMAVCAERAGRGGSCEPKTELTLLLREFGISVESFIIRVLFKSAGTEQEPVECREEKPTEDDATNNEAL